jgi:hypothetical protein
VATFYLAPTRAWELLVGAIVAMDMLPPLRNVPTRELAAVFGLVCVVVSIFTLTPATPFPGLAAAPACFGTALVIYTGRTGNTVTGRFLSWNVFVAIGLISYSLYLWHWPLLVFAKYRNIAPLSPWQTTVVIVATVALSVLSWKYVEQPLRKRATSSSLPVLMAGAAAMACAVIVAGTLVWSHGWPGRIPSAVLAIVNRHDLDSRSGCHGAFEHRLSSFCVRGAAGTAADFVLIGDSTAAAASGSVFDAAAAERHAGYQITDSAYTPTYGFEKWDETQKYTYMNRQVVKMLDGHPELRLIMIIVHWRQAVISNHYYDAGQHLVPGTVAVYEGLKGLAARYPGRSFVLSMGNPTSPLFGAQPKARALLFGVHFDDTLPMTGYVAERAQYEPVLRRLSALPNMHLIDPKDLLCTREGCPGSENGSLLYRDEIHLTPFGAHKLVPLFRAVFAPR